MKVTRNIPDQLIVENNPWLAGIFISLMAFIFCAVGIGIISSGEILPGIVFLLVGIFVGTLFTFILVRRVQIIFDRPGNSIEIRRKSVGNMTVVKHALSEFSHAIVEKSKRRRGQSRRTTTSTPAYRATLVFDKGMSAGEHPVTQVYSSGSGADRIVAAINEWHGVNR